MEDVRTRKRKERQARRKAEAILQEQQKRARERLASVREKQEDVDVRAYNALVTGLMPRIRGAVDSWVGRNIPMTIEFPATKFSAWTDFKQIRMDIPAGEVSIDFVGDLRGLAYHEAGHVRKTVPFLDLMGANLPTDEGDHYGSSGPHFTFLQEVWGLTAREVIHAWNILEDQRMETAMVLDSPNLGHYYNVIVLSHVVRNPDDLGNVWSFLVGRRHVDADVRAAARQAMLDSHGEAVVSQVETLVRSYMAATTAHDLWSKVIPFAVLLQALGATGGEVDDHATWGGPSDLSDEDLDALADAILDGAIPSDDGQPGTDSIPVPMDDATGDQPGGDKGEKSDTPSKGGKGEADDAAEDGDEDDDAGAEGEGGDTSKPEPGAGAGTGEGDADFMKRLSDALQRAVDKRNSDRNLIQDVKSFNEAYRDARSGTPLRRVMPDRASDNERMHKAIGVNRALRTMFEQARAETAPSWQSGQRNGVLDVIRYKTRQPGDMEFFRGYAEGGDMYLPDLAVSLILDGSGSMDHYDPDLGMAAFAVKSACDIFNIPCTVTVYDTDAWLLWDHEDRPLDMPVNFIPGGGTDPYEALNVVDSQTCDKSHHLVIIMTDGGWQGGWMGSDGVNGGRSLAEYAIPNRDVVVLFWNTPETNIRGLATVSAHKRIDSLMEIPQIVRRYILAAL